MLRSPCRLFGSWQLGVPWKLGLGSWELAVTVAAVCLAATLTACDRAETAPAAARPAPSPLPSAQAPAGEVVCATAPLRLRVVAVSQETPDSIRVELALTNAASREGWTPASPVAASVEAAVEALEGLSVLTTEGRRRVFPLRAEAGPRVGPRAEVPPPGETRRFWALFPVQQGPIGLLIPGFPALSGLVVTPAARPAPEP